MMHVVFSARARMFKEVPLVPEPIACFLTTSITKSFKTFSFPPLAHWLILRLNHFS